MVWSILGGIALLVLVAAMLIAYLTDPRRSLRRLKWLKFAACTVGGAAAMIATWWLSWDAFSWWAVASVVVAVVSFGVGFHIAEDALSPNQVRATDDWRLPVNENKYVAYVLLVVFGTWSVVLCREGFSWWGLLTGVGALVGAFILAEVLTEGRLSRVFADLLRRQKERDEQHIALAVELGCFIEISDYKSSYDGSTLGKVFDAVGGARYSEWKEQYSVSQHTVHCPRNGSTTVQLHCSACGESVEVTIKKAFVGYDGEGKIGDGKHRIMSPPQPKVGTSEPLSVPEWVVAFLALAVLLVGGWFGWGIASRWYTGWRVSSTADEFLAGFGSESPDEQRHGFEMRAISEKLEFHGFQSTSWDEFNPNPNRTAYDMTGTAELSDRRKIPLSLRIEHKNGRWQVQSFSFHSLPPDFLKEYALSKAKAVAEEVLTYQVAPDPLEDEYGMANKVVRSLQIYNYQSTHWKQTAYKPEEKLCILDGIATMKDGREIPLSLRIRWNSYWHLESFSSPIQHSQVTKEYAVSQATNVANDFLTLLAKSGSSEPGPPGSPMGGHFGEWLEHYGGGGPASWSTDDNIGRLFQKLRFDEYQSVQWTETTYEPGTLTCAFRGVAMLQRSRTVPLSIRVAFCRRSTEPPKNAWLVVDMTSP